MLIDKIGELWVAGSRYENLLQVQEDTGERYQVLQGNIVLNDLFFNSDNLLGYLYRMDVSYIGCNLSEEDISSAKVHFGDF